MKAKQLQENLRRMLRKKMNGSRWTGTALAERAGLQQAHISNFINGKRGLSLEAMDRVLATLRLSLLDLLDPADINQWANVPVSPDAHFQNIPLVTGYAQVLTPRITRGISHDILKFPSRFLRSLRPACKHARDHWERFVAMRVQAREAMGMFPRLLPGATVLIDRHYNSLKPYRPGDCNMFLVCKLNGECTIRYVEIAAGRLILRPHNRAYPLQVLLLPTRHPISHYIVGRIAHIGIET